MCNRSRALLNCHLPPPYFRSPVIRSGSTQSLLPCKGTFSQVPGTRSLMSLGDILSPASPYDWHPGLSCSENQSHMSKSCWKTEPQVWALARGRVRDHEAGSSGLANLWPPCYLGTSRGRHGAGSRAGYEWWLSGTAWLALGWLGREPTWQSSPCSQVSLVLPPHQTQIPHRLDWKHRETSSHRSCIC